MPRLHYSGGQLPTPDAFARELSEAREVYDPLEELLALERVLLLLEQQHGLSSAEFYQRFLAGEGGDSPEVIAWVGRYEVYLSLKAAISQSLSRAGLAA